MRAPVVAAALLLCSSLASAQRVAIGGTVVRDSAGTALAAATVTIPQLGLTTRTNYLGEFRLTGMPAGRYAIEIRQVGFAPLLDSITAGGAEAEREFVMRAQPVALDSVRVSAAAANTFPFQREVEERKKLGQGKIIENDELRANADNRNFANFLVSKIPGARLTRTGDGRQQYLATGRMACSGPAFSCKQAGTCWAALVIDGVVQFLPTVSGSMPDLEELKSEDFAAVEFYSAGAAPPQYSGTGYQCGVLLLWRRAKG